MKDIGKKRILGFEIGATKLIALVGDSFGNIFIKEQTKTRNNGKINELLDQIEYFYRKFSEKYKFDYISVAFPAAIDKLGRIMYAPNMPGWKHKNLIKKLKERFKEKIFVENDADAQALAEKLYGIGKDYKEFIYLTVGTGIGGAIFINNKLYRGYRGFAGEFGHIVIDKDGPQCGCGRKGCLEALASGKAISNNQKVPKESKLYRLEKIEGKYIFDAWRENDYYAKKIIDNAATDIAIGIANIINIFDPEVIIIGGGIIKNNRFFIKLIKDKIPYELANYKREVKILKSNAATAEKAPLAIVAYNETFNYNY